MATTYEQTTTTASTGPTIGIAADTLYVKTVPGILKIAEIVSSDQIFHLFSSNEDTQIQIKFGCASVTHTVKKMNR